MARGETKRETVTLKHPRCAVWINAWDEARAVLKSQGFDLGAVPNYHILYTDPDISAEASRHADRIRQREIKRQKRDVPVSYQLLTVGNAVVAELSWGSVA